MDLRHTCAALAAILGLGMTTTACTDDSISAANEPSKDSDASTSAAPNSTVSTEAPIVLARTDAPLEVTIGQLRGGVPGRERAQLRRAISEPIVSWIDGGFAVDDYPTNDFSEAFTAWTPQAASLAREHRDVTTNAAIGPDVQAVIIDERQVRLFVFATRGVVGGATAEVSLEVAGVRPDGSESRFTVDGELYLTRDSSTWQIFGYDLQRRSRS